MKLFQLSFDKLVIRFYLLMLIVMVAGFSGLWWIAFLALPVFFTSLMGITLGKKVTIKHTAPVGRQDATCSVEQVAAKV